MPDFAADAERAEDLREMQAALARCKAILTGILTSAGEARGENPEVTTLAAFVGELADEWRAQNAGCPLLHSDRATAQAHPRPEEARQGNACVSTCVTRGPPLH